MNARAKFLFDTDFAHGDTPRPGLVPLEQHQTALADAEAAGYRKGVVAGQSAAEARIEREIGAALAHAATSLQALAGGLDRLEARLETEAVEVAVAVANKLASALTRREPFAEIAALASECFRHLVSAPHVVVRVNDALYDEARKRLDDLAQRCGFDGRLVVLAEPEIASGDCRIEWADGGAVRNRAAVETAIASAVERYLAVRRPDAGPTESRSSEP